LIAGQAAPFLFAANYQKTIQMEAPTTPQTDQSLLLYLGQTPEQQIMSLCEIKDAMIEVLLHQLNGNIHIENQTIVCLQNIFFEASDKLESLLKNQFLN
jgi:hypothetical protein